MLNMPLFRSVARSLRIRPRTQFFLSGTQQNLKVHDIRKAFVASKPQQQSVWSEAVRDGNLNDTSSVLNGSCSETIQTCNHGHVEFQSKAMLPTNFGTFDTRVFKITETNELCVVMMVGEIGEDTKEIHMRLHDSCFTSEVLGSCKCDCKHQLEKAQVTIQKLVNSDCPINQNQESVFKVNGFGKNKKGNPKVGAIIYTFQEGRGIGLAAKMAAYDLQERLGYDTVSANEQLGLPVENREYSFVPGVLESLGLDIRRVSTQVSTQKGKGENINLLLLTSNPYKINALRDLGIKATMKPHIADINTESMAADYVRVKAERMGHVIADDAFFKTGQSETVINKVTDGLEAELLRLRENGTLRNGSSVLPFVTLSYAQSLDGTIGSAHNGNLFNVLPKKNGIDSLTAPNGHEPNGYKPSERLILSGDESMKMTHVLRASHEAIVVGVGTVLSDDPQLNVRFGVPGRNPIPVVLDSSLRTPLNCKLVTMARERMLGDKDDADFKLLILTSSTGLNSSEAHYSAEKSKAYHELSNMPGVRVVPIDSNLGTIDAGVPIMEAFQYLRQDCGFETVMVEGGARLIANILSKPIVNHIVMTIAPSFVPGGVKVESLPWQTVCDRSDLVSSNTFKLGDDLVVTGIIKR